MRILLSSAVDATVVHPYLGALRRHVRVLVAGAALVGCHAGGAEDQGAACDPQVPAENGHLRACAAGTSTANRPGVPGDFAGEPHRSMATTPAERAAIARANALAAKRHPTGAASIDLGFGPAVAPRSAR